MATKRITELQLRDDFDATCNVPVDDSTQSYRVTGPQISNYVNENLSPASASVLGAVKLPPDENSLFDWDGSSYAAGWDTKVSITVTTAGLYLITYNVNTTGGRAKLMINGVQAGEILGEDTSGNRSFLNTYIKRLEVDDVISGQVIRDGGSGTETAQTSLSASRLFD